MKNIPNYNLLSKSTIAKLGSQLGNNKTPLNYTRNCKRCNFQHSRTHIKNILSNKLQINPKFITSANITHRKIPTAAGRLTICALQIRRRTCATICRN